MADIAEALAAHDRMKRSTDLPLFYGRPEKDSIAPRLMIDRINRAAVSGGWNEARKCSELYLVLRDRALLWYDGLEHKNVDTNVWDQLKEAFLRSYEPRFTAKSTCANFAELVQKQNETVNDFYNRVHAVVKRLGAMRPVALNAVRAAHVGIADDIINPIKTEGSMDERKYWQQILFTAGLRDDLRLKVMDENKDTLAECFEVACDHESLLNEKRRTMGVTAIADDEDKALGFWLQDDIDNLEDDAFNTVNAVRNNSRLPPLRRSATYRQVVNNAQRSYANAARQSPSPSSASGNRSMNCRYCKKPGHLQKVCFSRIRHNAPMVDKDGKPYRINVVNNTMAAAADDASNSFKRDATISTINHLNW